MEGPTNTDVSRPHLPAESTTDSNASPVPSLSTLSLSSPYATQSDSASLSPFELLLRSHSSSLRRLLEAKRRDALSPQINKIYEKKDKQFIPSGPTENHQWIQMRMFKTDAREQFSPWLERAGVRVRSFMDLGAAPGGWAWWLLERYEEARGVGVELPMEKGGRDVLSKKWKKGEAGRYRVVRKDLLKVLEDETAIGGKLPKSQDVVLAGAIPNEVPRGSPQARQFHVSPAALLLTLNQLYLAFAYLKDGGTFIGFHWKKAFLVNSEIVLLLRASFKALVPCPGSKPYSIKSTYQIVALGFDGSMREEGLRRIKSAIQKLQAFPPEHRARDNGVLIWDGTEEEIFEREKDWLLGFYNPLWDVQTEAIENRQKLVLESNRKHDRKSSSGSNESSDASVIARAQ